MVGQHRLSQLRFGDRGGDLKQRLTGEDNVPFGDRPHLPGEPQARQRAQGLLPVAPGLAQVAQVIGGEREVLQELQAVRQPGGNQEPAARRQIPDEQAECRRSGHGPAQVTGRHVELI